MATRDDPLFNMRLDAEDRALLDALCLCEKLNKSDIVRRAIRAYAKELGVKVPKVARKK